MVWRIQPCHMPSTRPSCPCAMHSVKNASVCWLHIAKLVFPFLLRGNSCFLRRSSCCLFSPYRWWKAVRSAKVVTSIASVWFSSTRHWLELWYASVCNAANPFNGCAEQHATSFPSSYARDELGAWGVVDLLRYLIKIRLARSIRQPQVWYFLPVLVPASWNCWWMERIYLVWSWVCLC